MYRNCCHLNRDGCIERINAYSALNLVVLMLLRIKIK